MEILVEQGDHHLQDLPWRPVPVKHLQKKAFIYEPPDVLTGLSKGVTQCPGVTSAIWNAFPPR